MMLQNNVQDIRKEFIRKKNSEEYIIDKSGVKTIEIINANFIADENTIFGSINEDYVKREIEWYNSTSLNVYDIPGEPPEIWKKIADSEGFINSNYGWCIFTHDNYSQYRNTIDELLKNPDSRRAIMIYTRPSMWIDYNYDGRSDFICTNTVQYLIRDNKLDVIVQMRSNDAIFGYKNDFYWQKYVQELAANELNVPCGKIYWNAGSLHVYERHFYLVE